MKLISFVIVVVVLKWPQEISAFLSSPPSNARVKGMGRRRLCSSSLLQSSTVTTPSSTKAQKVTTAKNELKSKKTQTKNNPTLSKAKSTQTNGTPKKESSMTVVSKQKLKQSNSTTKKTSTTTTKGKSRVFVRAKKNAAPLRKNSNNNGANSTSSSSASSIIKTFKPLKDLKLGSLLSGTVVDVCDFGAFINIGYATYGSRAGTALLHISQIQDTKISNIHDILKVGDTIKDARVTSIDLNKGEVGLSLRTPRSTKRRDISTMKVGDELIGKVDSIVPYGVFVDVGTSVNALLHISRITGGAIENVRQHLNEGDVISVHVIDIDTKKKTLAVSMLDKKADQYLDRRMSQRLKRFYGGTATTSAVSASVVGENDETSDLDYFELAIRELEEALRDRTQ
jgi:predicted RNA-binding protein with RPS1 domain